MTGDRLARVLAYLAEHAASRGAAMTSRAACAACADLVGASGAGLTLSDRTGRVDSVYATSGIGKSLEEAQFTLGEGPGSDAYGTGAPVLVAELDSDHSRARWPVFVPAALLAGVRSVFAFPLRTGAVRLGTLLLHRATAGPLTREQVADSLVVADVLLSLVLTESTSPSAVNGHSFDGGVLVSRPELHQAAGMVSVQLGVSIEEALVRMRGHAFATASPITEVARAIVGRRLRLGPAAPEPDVNTTEEGGPCR